MQTWHIWSFILGLFIVLFFVFWPNYGEIINDNRRKTSRKKVAVIVEPRKHVALAFVVENMINVTGWHVQVFHGIHNKSFCDHALEKWIKKGKVSLVNMNVVNFDSPQEYSKYMTSLDFWDKVEGEHVLSFQTDSMLLSNTNHTVDEFIEYDFVGAPWVHLNGAVGNGGLSMRTKSSAIATIQNAPPDPPGENEDWVFSSYIGRDDNEYKLAGTEVGKHFAVETMWYEKPFGIHKIWCTLPPDQYQQFLKIHPEVAELEELQHFF